MREGGSQNGRTGLPLGGDPAGIALTGDGQGLPGRLCGPPKRAIAVPTDADLLRRVAAGDQQALAILHSRYWQELLDFVRRRTRTWHERAAEDVVSDVFRCAWRDRRLLLSVRNPRAYLLGMARNMAARRCRAGHARTRILPPDVASPTLAPDAEMERDELGRQIEGALASLADSRRQVIDLAHDGLSAKQIASAVNCTEKAVRRRLAKARMQVQNLLSRCGDSCVMNERRPEECPAREGNCYCLKWLYTRMLRSR